MSSTLGNNLKISVFGESHGNGIGVVIDGLPAGKTIDMEAVLVQMKRRAPGRDKTATPRKESDAPKILSGMLGSTLTGAPLCARPRRRTFLRKDHRADRFCGRGLPSASR